MAFMAGVSARLAESGVEWAIETIDESAMIHTPDITKSAFSRADAIITSFVFPFEHVHLMDHVRIVQVAGAGVDRFVPSAQLPNAWLCNSYEHEIGIAEYALTFMLLHSTRILSIASSYAATGSWERSSFAAGKPGAPHSELYRRTVGLVGFGKISTEIAVRARAFGMRVIATRTTPAPNPLLDWCGGSAKEDLHRLLRESDVVVLAAPLNDVTRGMLGHEELSIMKPSALLINVGRAQLCHEEALYNALKDGRIAGAALDVWYQYPDESNMAYLMIHTVLTALRSPSAVRIEVSLPPAPQRPRDASLLGLDG